MTVRILLVSAGGFAHGAQSGRPQAVLRAAREVGEVHTYDLGTPGQLATLRAKSSAALPLLGFLPLADRSVRLLRRNSRAVSRAAVDVGADVVVSTTTLAAGPYSDGRVPLVAWPDSTLFTMQRFAGSYPTLAAMRGRAWRSALALERESLSNVTILGLPTRRSIADLPEDLRDRAVLAPFGPNLPMDFLDEVRAARAGNQLGSSFRILFLGVDWERKNGEFATRVVEHLRRRGVEARLDVVGVSGRDTDCVSFHGRLSAARAEDRRQLLRVFSSARALLFPSTADNFGAAVADCIHAGIPVVSSEDALVSEHLHPSAGVIVPGWETGAYADALLVYGSTGVTQVPTGFADSGHLSYGAGLRSLLRAADVS